MIVCKFGGSSVAKEEGAKCIKNIVNKNKNIKFVVVSALGKNEKFKTKVTDLLFLLHIKLINGDDYSKIVDEIFYRHKVLSEGLSVNINWKKLKQEFLNILQTNNFTKEFIVSRGEYYSSILYAKYLGFKFLDAKDYIIFDKTGKFNEHITKQKLRRLNINKKYVMGGYYGAKPNGTICVFDRGGSDITGAIICKLLKMNIYENYTDVSGIYNKNPNIFTNAKSMPVISYKTAISMAEGGNEIVHKDALKIVKNSNILLLVKSTYNNKNLGTVVVDNEVAISNNFICTSEVVVIELKFINKEIIGFLKGNSDILYIIKNKNKVYAVTKSIYIQEKTLFKFEWFLKIYDAILFLIFSKVGLKNIKNIKKMAYKIEKTAILSKFLSVFNNYLIFCNKGNGQKIINIINNYNI